MNARARGNSGIRVAARDILVLAVQVPAEMEVLRAKARKA